jgi:hypothetical protein
MRGLVSFVELRLKVRIADHHVHVQSTNKFAPCSWSAIESNEERWANPNLGAKECKAAEVWLKLFDILKTNATWSLSKKGTQSVRD